MRVKNYMLHCPEGYFAGLSKHNDLKSFSAIVPSFSSDPENAILFSLYDAEHARRIMGHFGFSAKIVELSLAETFERGWDNLSFLPAMKDWLEDYLEEKKEMTAFNENGSRKVYAFDLDGTLAIGGPFWEKEPEPNEPMITRLIELYHQGNIIIIWTARQWHHAPETVAWLTKYRIPFHGIYMSKGGADVYVDDKMVSLEEICQDSK